MPVSKKPSPTVCEFFLSLVSYHLRVASYHKQPDLDISCGRSLTDSICRNVPVSGLSGRGLSRPGSVPATTYREAAVRNKHRLPLCGASGLLHDLYGRRSCFTSMLGSSTTVWCSCVGKDSQGIATRGMVFLSLRAATEMEIELLWMTKRFFPLSILYAAQSRTRHRSSWAVGPSRA